MTKVLTPVQLEWARQSNVAFFEYTEIEESLISFVLRVLCFTVHVMA
jgi:hypothetical protein